MEWRRFVTYLWSDPHICTDHSISCCLQALMLITGGSGHFYLSRDPPPAYTANITYTSKQPRQIAVSCVPCFCWFANELMKLRTMKFWLWCCMTFSITIYKISIVVTWLLMCFFVMLLVTAILKYT